MIIFDTHTHDYFDSFDTDREEMMRENFSDAVGVIGKIQIGCDMKTSVQAFDLANKYHKIWSTLGIHPCEVEKNFSKLDTIFSAFQNLVDTHPKKIVGVGETGFDFFHKDTPQMREKQKISFIKHLEFGLKNTLPIVIHTRNAQDETIAFLRENKNILGRGVFHCFSQNSDFAQIATQEFGYFLGIGGTATYKKNGYIREAIQNTPIEFLVTETDSPYLAPQSVRGTRNNSGNIAEIIELIAELKNIPVEKCAEILVENAKKLFSIKNYTGISPNSSSSGGF